MKEEALKLLIQYKETEKLMLKYIDLLDEKDYANGKIDLVRSIIIDLERLTQTSN